MEERFQLLEQVGNFSVTPASMMKRILKQQGISYISARKKTFKEKFLGYFDTSESDETTRKEIIIG